MKIKTKKPITWTIVSCTECMDQLLSNTARVRDMFYKHIRVAEGKLSICVERKLSTYVWKN